jgi:RNA polymerase sigma-70 factor (sigma-E family)
MNRRAERDDDFTAFVAAQSARLVNFAYLLCGHRATAEDLTQTALVKTYARWDRTVIEDPLAYVRRAILNESRRLYRRRPPWRERPAGVAADLEPRRELQAPDPAGEVVGSRAVVEALAILTARERSVIVLRYVEDLTEAETARLLDIAIGTVKSTHARALAKLRRAEHLSHQSFPDKIGDPR